MDRAEPSAPGAAGVDAAHTPFAEYHARRIASYDAGWGGFVPQITGLVAAGRDLRRLVEWFDGDTAEYCGFIAGWLAKQMPRIDLGRFAGEAPPRRLAVLDGRYVSLPTAPSHGKLFDYIAGCIDPEVDCVVEFGSGLGFNLARVRLRQPSAPMTYLACEPSANGRLATERIFAADRAARFEAHPFDYEQPDLSCLTRFRRIVAFTSHSIEQRPLLGETFYRALLNTNIATCVHIEPVGWQRFPELSEFVGSLYRDYPAWLRFRAAFPIVLEDDRLVANAAYWAASSGYNTDLLSLIRRAEARGEITLSALDCDVVGLNPFNPSTLIAWRRR